MRERVGNIAATQGLLHKICAAGEYYCSPTLDKVRVSFSIKHHVGIHGATRSANQRLVYFYQPIKMLVTDHVNFSANQTGAFV